MKQVKNKSKNLCILYFLNIYQEKTLKFNFFENNIIYINIGLKFIMFVLKRHQKNRISSIHLQKYIKSRRKYLKFPYPRFIHVFCSYRNIFSEKFSFNSAPNKYIFIRVTPRDTSILFQKKKEFSKKMRQKKIRKIS